MNIFFYLFNRVGLEDIPEFNSINLINFSIKGLKFYFESNKFEWLLNVLGPLPLMQLMLINQHKTYSNTQHKRENLNKQHKISTKHTRELLEKFSFLISPQNI